MDGLVNHDDVISAIHDRREVLVTWSSQEDGGALQSRRCAPMDCGPGRIANDRAPRYHFWDLESDTGINHTLSLRADQITTVEVLETRFAPSDFVTWKPNWVIARDTWGDLN